MRSNSRTWRTSCCSWPHIRPPGPVGRIRHYENEAPDLLVLREGRVVQLALDPR